MGADQSKPSTSEPSSGTQTPIVAGPGGDYYTLLGIDEGAGESEIKKAFRKQALIWHPDKNAHRVAESTAYFSTLQEAYEILIDPQERAFYDRRLHQKGNGTSAESNVSSAEFDEVLRGQREVPKPTGRGMGVNELMRFFEKRVWDKGGMGDKSGGFFQVYGTLFQYLAAEEDSHSGGKGRDYPTFGTSTTPWSLPARSETQARNFYAIWSGFATEKSFDWVEMWEADRGEDRRVRRLMEKDNKKAREEARREYNDTVRQLIAYIKKRDPRVPAAPKPPPLFASRTTRSTPASGSSSPKPKTKSGASSAAPPVDFTPQAWQNAAPSADQVLAEDSESEDEQAVWECVACGKTGRSEGRWRDHERSRGHVKEVERVKREMRKEDRELGLGGAEGDSEEEEELTEEEEEEATEEEEEEEEEDEVDDEDNLADALARSTLQDAEIAAALDLENDHNAPPPAGAEEEEEEEEEEDGEVQVPGESKKARKKRTREEREARKRRELEAEEEGKRKSKKAMAEEAQEAEGAGSDGEDGGAEGSAAGGKARQSKKELRREREKKKAEKLKALAAGGAGAEDGAAAGGGGEGGPERCAVCTSSFPSRTKLFAHIKSTGHAAPPDAVRGGDDDGFGGKSGKGKKGKRR